MSNPETSFASKGAYYLVISSLLIDYKGLLMIVTNIRNVEEASISYLFIPKETVAVYDTEGPIYLLVFLSYRRKLDE